MQGSSSCLKAIHQPSPTRNARIAKGFIRKGIHRKNKREARVPLGSLLSVGANSCPQPDTPSSYSRTLIPSAFILR